MVVRFGCLCVLCCVFAICEFASLCVAYWADKHNPCGLWLVAVACGLRLWLAAVACGLWLVACGLWLVLLAMAAACGCGLWF